MKKIKKKIKKKKIKNKKKKEKMIKMILYRVSSCTISII